MPPRMPPPSMPNVMPGQQSQQNSGSLLSSPSGGKIGLLGHMPPNMTPNLSQPPPSLPLQQPQQSLFQQNQLNLQQPSQQGTSPAGTAGGQGMSIPGTDTTIQQGSSYAGDLQSPGIRDNALALMNQLLQTGALGNPAALSAGAGTSSGNTTTSLSNPTAASITPNLSVPPPGHPALGNPQVSLGQFPNLQGLNNSPQTNFNNSLNSLNNTLNNMTSMNSMMPQYGSVSGIPSSASSPLSSSGSGSSLQGISSSSPSSSGLPLPNLQTPPPNMQGLKQPLLGLPPGIDPSIPPPNYPQHTSQGLLPTPNVSSMYRNDMQSQQGQQKPPQSSYNPSSAASQRSQYHKTGVSRFLLPTFLANPFL